MAKKVLRLFLVPLLALLTAGCWDRVEINERGFVIGVAIDEPRSKDAEKANKKEAKDKPAGKQRYSVTYQFVIPQKLQGGSGQAADTSFMNLTSEGDTMSDIDRQMTARTSRSPYFEHLKMVIISEKIAKKSESIGHVLDFFLRDQEMRRSTKILISDEEARKALEVVPNNEKLPVMYIESVSRNNTKTGRMLPETKLGDLHELLLDRKGFAVQRIIGAQKEVKIVGAAVFRGHDIKMAGDLGSEETEGLNLLTGKMKTGILKFKVKDNLMVYEIMQSKHNIKADVSDPERLHFTITIDTEGIIGETLTPVDFMEKGILKKLEAGVSQEIKRMTKDTLRKLQKEFKADAIGLGSYLEQNYYRVWKQIEDNWEQKENLFSQCTVDVEVKVHIRRTGVINRTHY
ncbi:MAG: gerLC [Paenibacillus sp.]|jgi:spore germination protein|nr:gerLC [Paenibacillus sp.]